MMTDPVADMLTRIRNAIQIERPYVEMPASKVKIGIADALKREGYIWEYQVVEQEPQNVLQIQLKYGPNGERIVQHLSRTSKPGRRIYTRSTEIPQVLKGMGVCILSTNKGVLSSREAKKQGIGGEILCTVW